MAGLERDLAVLAWGALESVAYGTGGLKKAERALVNEYVLLFPRLDGFGKLCWSSLEDALGMCTRLREQQGYDWLAEMSYLGPGLDVRREYFFVPERLGQRLSRSRCPHASLSFTPILTDTVPRWLVENLLMAYNRSVIHEGLFREAEDELDGGSSPGDGAHVAASLSDPGASREV